MRVSCDSVGNICRIDSPEQFGHDPFDLNEILTVKDPSGVIWLPTTSSSSEHGQVVVRRLQYITPSFGILEIARSFEPISNSNCVYLSLAVAIVIPSDDKCRLEWSLKSTLPNVLVLQRYDSEVSLNAGNNFYENIYVCRVPSHLDVPRSSLSGIEGPVFRRCRNLELSAEFHMQLNVRIFTVSNEYDPVGQSQVAFVLNSGCMSAAVGAIACPSRGIDSWGDYRTFSLERFVSPLYWVTDQMESGIRESVFAEILRSKPELVVSNAQLTETEEKQLAQSGIDLSKIFDKTWGATWEVQKAVREKTDLWASASVIDIGAPVWPGSIVSAYCAWSKRHPYLVYSPSVYEQIREIGQRVEVTDIEIFGTEPHIPKDFVRNLRVLYLHVRIEHYDFGRLGNHGDLLQFFNCQTFILREMLSRLWVKAATGESDLLEDFSRKASIKDADDVFGQAPDVTLWDIDLLSSPECQVSFPPLTVLGIYEGNLWQNAVTAASYAKAKRANFIAVECSFSNSDNGESAQDLESEIYDRRDLANKFGKLTKSVALKTPHEIDHIIGLTTRALLTFATPTTPLVELVTTKDRFSDPQSITTVINTGRLDGKDIYHLAATANRLLWFSLVYAAVPQRQTSVIVSTDVRFSKEADIVAQLISSSLSGDSLSIFSESTKGGNENGCELSPVKWQPISAALEASQLIYFNCHGEMDVASGPTFWCDGRRGMDDIPKLDGMPLVYLSACQTGLGHGLSSSGSLASGFLDRGAVAVVAFLNKIEATGARRIADDFFILLPFCSIGTAITYCRRNNPEDRSLSAISLVLFGDPIMAFRKQLSFIDYLVWFEKRGNSLWHSERTRKMDSYAVAASSLKTAARYGLAGLRLASKQPEMERIVARLGPLAARQAGFALHIEHASADLSRDERLERLQKEREIYEIIGDSQQYLPGGLWYQVTGWRDIEAKRFQAGRENFSQAASEFQKYMDAVSSERWYEHGYRFAKAAREENLALARLAEVILLPRDARRAAVNEARTSFEKALTAHPSRDERLIMYAAAIIYLERLSNQEIPDAWSLLTFQGKVLDFGDSAILADIIDRFRDEYDGIGTANS
jgi:CHAT domain